MLLEIIFWTCLGAMVYSYALYPLLTSVLVAVRNPGRLTQQGSAGRAVHSHMPRTSPEAQPTVFILFAAYNEEKVIGKKLESILSSNYPLEKIHVWVGSDCSTDGTDDIVRSFSERHAGVKLIRFPERTGKTGILNALVKDFRSLSSFQVTSLRAESRSRSGRSEAISSPPEMASSEVIGTHNPGSILILTDANVMFEPDTIAELVYPFQDPRIGIVGANIRNVESSEGISGQERAYIQRENRIKYREGVLWGAVMGAFGACYAIRPELFPLIPSNILMEDFYVTMHVLELRRKVVINPKAVCVEDVSVKVREEFKRKRRISAGNFQNLVRYWRLLFSFRPAGFAFFSHKVLRWFGPFFIIGALVSCVVLAGGNAPRQEIYLIALLIGSALVLLSLMDFLLLLARIHFAPLRLLSYFMAMNAALLSGLVMYVRGVKKSVWRPTERL